MTSEPARRRPRTAVAALVAVAGLAAVYAVYAIRAGQGNGELAVPVPAGSGITRALSTGTMAAFVVKPVREPVGEVRFTDGSGAARTLAEWKGRVVLVNLWATWCAPCRKEMPDLARLQEAYGGDDFEVVAISVDLKGAEASAAFLNEIGVTSLALYVDPTLKAMGALKAVGLPATILIDRDGREIGRLLGPAEWASPEARALIEAALAEPRP